MFMSAEIELAGNNTLALPEDAFVRFENKHYVFVAKGRNTFEMLEVQTGSTQNGFTEILTDKLAGRELVTRGAYNLLMAMKNKSEE